MWNHTCFRPNDIASFHAVQWQLRCTTNDWTRDFHFKKMRFQFAHYRFCESYCFLMFDFSTMILAFANCALTPHKNVYICPWLGKSAQVAWPYVGHVFVFCVSASCIWSTTKLIFHQTERRSSGGGFSTHHKIMPSFGLTRGIYICSSIDAVRSRQTR